MNEYPKALQTVFLVHAIISMLVGLQHIFFPQLPGKLTGIELSSPILYRVLGVAVFAFGVSSALAIRERYWDNVKILVTMEILWSLFGAVVIAWGVISDKLPAIEWPNAILLFIFALLFSFFGRKRL